MLTRRQRDLLHYIEGYVASRSMSPSFEEMREAMGLQSKSGIHRLLTSLEERRFIRRIPNRARAIELLHDNHGTTNDDRTETVTLPLVGRIVPGRSIEPVGATHELTVARDLIGAGTHYALEVGDDSMVRAGILAGDHLLIRRQETAREGDIVVALLNGDIAVLGHFHREDGGRTVRLDPANEGFRPQRHPGSAIRIQGVVAALRRRYAPPDAA